MSDVYLIKKETLTAIADAIRNGSQWDGAWRDVDITPEQMPSAIEDIRYDGYYDGEETGYAAGYDKGYDDGYEEGKADGGVDLEALGVLCEWSVMSDTSSTTGVSIINHHPSYYLHCDVSLKDNYGVQHFSIHRVARPNNSTSYWFQQVITDGSMLNVTNVRWKASET